MAKVLSDVGPEVTDMFGNTKFTLLPDICAGRARGPGPGPGERSEDDAAGARGHRRA